MKRKKFEDMATMLEGKLPRVPQPVGPQSLRIRYGRLTVYVNVDGRTITAAPKWFARFIGQPLHKLTQAIQDDQGMFKSINIQSA